MITGKSSFWMDGEHNNSLKKTAERWWELVASWLQFPFTIYDEEKADIRIVDLLAWQRQIERFDGEPEALYRKRVKYAFINAVDAGTPAGMKRIFERLDIDKDVEFNERLDGYDWDMIELRMSPEAFEQYQTLLNVLLNQYGRTCRRWIYRIDRQQASLKAYGVHIINSRILVYPRSET